MPDVPDAFQEELRRTGCPLDPERACRLIRRTRAVWERAGFRLYAIRIVCGGGRGVATVLWDAERDELAALLSWQPAPPKRAVRYPTAPPGSRGRPVAKFRMTAE